MQDSKVEFYNNFKQDYFELCLSILQTTTHYFYSSDLLSAFLAISMVHLSYIYRKLVSQVMYIYCCYFMISNSCCCSYKYLIKYLLKMAILSHAEMKCRIRTLDLITLPFFWTPTTLLPPQRLTGCNVLLNVRDLTYT